MGFIDLVGVSEENLCDVKFKLKNIIVKPNSREEHSIYVEVELEAFCRVFENKEINIIQDMYSTSRNISFKENKVNTMVDMQNSEEVINIRERIRLEDIEHTKVCDMQVMPSINETNISTDRLKASGELEVNLILTNQNEDDVITLNQKIAFDFSKEITGLNAQSKVSIDIVPVFREVVTDDMEVSIKVDLVASINSYNLETINVIDSIEELEENDEHPYSMVIYFVKKGDTLWKIAKKYKSTVEDIVRINNIENPDRIDVGMQLFIPKCSMCRTEISM